MVVDALTDTPLVTPFDVDQNVTGTEMPAIMEYDYATNSTITSGNLLGNVTQTIPTNSTDSSPLDPITDSVFYPIAILQGFINFLTGGFIWQTLALFGLPSVFVIHLIEHHFYLMNIHKVTCAYLIFHIQETNVIITTNLYFL